MLRPICIAALAACSLALPGCLIVVDRDSETHWVHDDAGHARHIGVSLESVDDTTASQLALDRSKVTVVDRVIDDSAADHAGLKAHDIITAVDGDADACPSHVREAIRNHKSGESVSFVILRQGKPLTIAVQK